MGQVLVSVLDKLNMMGKTDSQTQNYNKVQLLSQWSKEQDMCVPSISSTELLLCVNFQVRFWENNNATYLHLHRAYCFKHSLSTHLIWLSQQTCEICRPNINIPII